MKKIISLALVLVMALALASCGAFSIFGDVAEEGDVTVVVETADGSFEIYETSLESVENKEEGVKGVLENLCDREENPLHLVTDATNFVTEIGSIKQDAASSAYVMIYTSLESDSYAGAPTVQYEGMTLYQSGFGIGDMTVKAGSVIFFRLEVYG